MELKQAYCHMPHNTVTGAYIDPYTVLSLIDTQYASGKAWVYVY